MTITNVNTGYIGSNTIKAIKNNKSVSVLMHFTVTTNTLDGMTVFTIDNTAFRPSSKYGSIGAPLLIHGTDNKSYACRIKPDGEAVTYGIIPVASNYIGIANFITD